MAKQTFTTGQVLTAAEMTALQLNDYNQTVSAKVASYVLVAADAGTRITMSNAGATTITVNTSLFAAGDTLFITNIGAGASTITAGTATVSTASSLVLAQYDSGRLYFTSTGVAIWEKYQGAAAASSSGMTFLKQATFSNVATTTTTFDSMFSSTYLSYLVTIDSLYAGTAADDLQLQFLYSGTTQAAGYYGSALQSPISGTTLTITGTNNAAQITLSSAIGATAQIGSGYFYVTNASSGVGFPSINGIFTELNGSSPGFFGGSPSTQRSYTGFLLKSSSSNITGTVSVYGLVKA
jgi:hypothetical protein